MRRTNHKSVASSALRRRATSLRPLRRAALPGVAALVVAAAPAEAAVLGPETPRSPNAEAISTTYWVLLGLAVVLLVVLHAALLLALTRFRERRGRRPAQLTAGRRAMAAIAAAFGALAIAVFVFGVVMTVETRTIEETGSGGLGANANQLAQVGVSGLPEDEVAESSEIGQQVPGAAPAAGEEADAEPPLEIDVIGQQWLWRFEYPSDNAPGQQLFSYGELVVPTDTAVVLNVTSTDVIHQWWIPQLGGQVQAVPGTVTQTWFKAEEPGLYRGDATVFNGTAFPAMRAQVRAVSPEEYQSYVQELEADLRRAQEAVAEVQRGASPAPGTAGEAAQAP